MKTRTAPKSWKVEGQDLTSTRYEGDVPYRVAFAVAPENLEFMKMADKHFNDDGTCPFEKLAGEMRTSIDRIYRLSWLCEDTDPPFRAMTATMAIEKIRPVIDALLSHLDAQRKAKE